MSHPQNKRKRSLTGEMSPSPRPSSQKSEFLPPGENNESTPPDAAPDDSPPRAPRGETADPSRNTNFKRSSLNPRRRGGRKDPLSQRNKKATNLSRSRNRAPLAPIKAERKTSPIASADFSGFATGKLHVADLPAARDLSPGSAWPQDPLLDVPEGSGMDVIVTRRSRSGLPVGRRRLAPVSAPGARKEGARDPPFADGSHGAGSVVLPRIGSTRQGFSARRNKLPTLQESPAQGQRVFQARKQKVPLPSQGRAHEAKWEVEDL